MSVTAKHLKELDDIAESVNRMDESVNVVLSSIAQQFENIAQETFLGIAQQIEESNRAVFSSIAQQIAAVNSEYFTGFIHKAFENLSRYSGPAFTPPPLYVRQSHPQLPPNVKFIDGELVYIDDYEPGLN